jgi:predicted XRE-type DNA-binding protein
MMTSKEQTDLRTSTGARRRQGQMTRKGRRESASRTEEEVVAVERFRVEVQYVIQQLMADRGLSQSQLASRLGMTQPRVSQIFSQKCNLTIRLMARIFHALDDQCFVWSGRLDELATSGQIPLPPLPHFCPRIRVGAPEFSGWVGRTAHAVDDTAWTGSVHLTAPRQVRATVVAPRRLVSTRGRLPVRSRPGARRP